MRGGNAAGKSCPSRLILGLGSHLLRPYFQTVPEGQIVTCTSPVGLFHPPPHSGADWAQRGAIVKTPEGHSDSKGWRPGVG